MSSLWKFLSSLRLTVWLLGISVLLVFLGSLAQVNEGLWNAQARWFKSWAITTQVGDFRIPFFPGGHLLGALLLANLLAAHFKRFKFSFEKFGIQLTHFGVIVMIIGQGITDKKQVESFLGFEEGEARNFTEHHRDAELVFLRDKDAGNDEVVAFHEDLFKPRGLFVKSKLPADLKHEKLPFTVRVLEFGMNGDVLSPASVKTMAERLKTALATLDGKFSTAEALAPVAETDMANVERAMTWRRAMKKLDGSNAELLAEVKRRAVDPKQAAELMAAVKKQFREDMLGAFKQAGERARKFGEPRMGPEMQFVAELEEAGHLADAEKEEAKATNGSGRGARIVNRAEVKDDKMGRNFQWAVIEIIEGGKSLGTWLASSRLNPQEFEVAGQKWRVQMRNERYYLPYNLQLVRARQEVYQGTSQAKVFASRVRIINPYTKEDRSTDITMNNPLRYADLTFYQSTMGQGERGPGTAALLSALSGRPAADFVDMEEKEGGRNSGLQVVGNPSMLAPYTGCLLVGFGMLWQFLFHLTRFLAKRAGLPPPDFGVPHPLLPVCALLIMLPDVFLAWIAIKNGTLFALTVVAVTPFIRGVLAWQVWRGKHLVFSMVLLLVPTILAVPFALKYQETHGSMLWPVSIAQFAAFLGIAYVVFSNRPRTIPAHA
ncbi:MAG: cytochrome c biogenesis protein ResB [Verrucomicrobia bacterium]|nr:cytochrome c biogenesis protein ResB [Verrucomicrobiota bacterium]